MYEGNTKEKWAPLIWNWEKKLKKLTSSKCDLSVQCCLKPVYILISMFLFDKMEYLLMFLNDWMCGLYVIQRLFRSHNSEFTILV